MLQRPHMSYPTNKVGGTLCIFIAFTALFGGYLQKSNPKKVRVEGQPHWITHQLQLLRMATATALLQKGNGEHFAGFLNIQFTAFHLLSFDHLPPPPPPTHTSECLHMDI
jgi:hypothetical protein